jgi:phage protein D/phage baseplate assembly protein gpV
MTAPVTPRAKIRLAGRDLPVDLIAARVASRLSQPAECELTLAGSPRDTLGGWPFGGRLQLAMTGEDGDLFDGEITAVELGRTANGGAITTVRAYDRLHRLRRRQQLGVFEALTVAQLAEALTAGLGITVLAEQAGPVCERLAHHRGSDLELLTVTAAQAGLYAVLRGGLLTLCGLAPGGPAQPGAAGPAVIDAASLWQAGVEADLDGLVRRVDAFGWHPQRAEVVREQADGAPTGMTAALRASVLDPALLGGDGVLTLTDQPGRSSAQLAAAAQAALDHRAAQTVVVTGVCDGDRQLWAGQTVQLRGLAAEVDGAHRLAAVEHTVDGDGYRTSFSTRPPAAPAAATGTSVTLGRVTGVDDPDGRGRVRVSLPALGDLDAGWLGVLCAGAGAGRGLVVLPDVDDTVLVALPHETPAEGIVLGAVFGMNSPHDAGVDGGAVRRWSMRSRAGQSIVIDDGRQLIRLENAEGSVVELAPGRVRLHAKADLLLEAPGRTITIRAGSVDFEHAPLPDLVGATAEALAGVAA